MGGQVMIYFLALCIYFCCWGLRKVIDFIFFSFVFLLLDSSSIADNLARVMCGVKKINTASGVTDFEDMRTAFYVGMGRLRSSSLTTRLSHLWATARRSTENHDDIVTGTKGQLQVESEAPVEFTCLYDCEKTDLAILGCENTSNTALHMHEFGNLLYVGQNLKLAGFGQSLERANPFVPSVKSVNVARTNCSIFDCVGWKNVKFFVVDQVVDFGYSGSPIYHPANGDVIGMLCGSFQKEFANVSMCLKAHHIGDALDDNFILKRKRIFSCL
jgi:hypothetical protein